MWELINLLGQKIGASERNRQKWRTRGIPGKYHVPLIRLAKRLKVKLPPESLLKTYPATKRKDEAA